MTVTEKLHTFRQLKRQLLSRREIARRLDVEQARLSNFAVFWHLVDHGALDEMLVKVILVHSKEDNPRGLKTRQFRFDKVRVPKGLNFRKTEPMVRYTRQQQAAALQHAFEVAKKVDKVSPETIEDCSCSDIRCFRYDAFLGYLKKNFG